MKKWVGVVGVLAVAFIMAGCATSVYERHTGLKMDAFSRTCDYSSLDFEVLGPVEASGSSMVVVGIVARGNEGYGLLMKEARRKYGADVTTVMFIFSDYDYKGILYPLIGKIETSYSGTAVKMKSISQTANVRVRE